MFAPYATVNTNLIFFEKGKPTKEIWYYEHTLPKNVKAYSKTKPIRVEEFEALRKWWYNRKESEIAWKISIESIVEKNYDLDIKNPFKKEEEIVLDRKVLITSLEESFLKAQELLNHLKN